jgi:hypothetical protein
MGASPAESRFLRIADAVSTGMGSPLNIALWAAATIAWIMAFVINPDLQNSNFLPSWFTSNSFNFPLNSISTLAELFIGFLIAAAANRVEKRNYDLHQTMARMLAHLEVLTEAVKSEVDHEDGELHEILALLRERREKDTPDR